MINNCIFALSIPFRPSQSVCLSKSRCLRPLEGTCPPPRTLKLSLSRSCFSPPASSESSSQRNMSSVWAYFEPEKSGRRIVKAKFKQCNKPLHYGTNGMKAHLATHGIEVSLGQKASSEDTSQRPVTDFFHHQEKDSLNGLLARLCAKDGLPFSVIANSKDISEMINSKGIGKCPLLIIQSASMSLHLPKKSNKNILPKCKRQRTASDFSRCPLTNGPQSRTGDTCRCLFIWIQHFGIWAWFEFAAKLIIFSQRKTLRHASRNLASSWKTLWR